MLSILIPVFNFDIRPLVEGLNQQCSALGLNFEILCFDDGSEEEYKKRNRNVQAHLAVRYKELAENQGRARIRNLLAEAAQHPHLLFMDCDSGLVRDNYIETYVQQLGKGQVLYGGRCYAEKPPTDLDLRFHWTYGRAREEKLAAHRAKQAYHSFMTNNFLMPRAQFLEIGFEEQLKQYGHEDTLFGLELSARKIPIVHLDNPLEHLGLETASSFLKKTTQGIENLAFLAATNPLIETKLLRSYRKLSRFGLAGAAGLVLERLNPMLVKNLKSSNPRLFYFDLYKLGLLIQSSKQTKN